MPKKRGVLTNYIERRTNAAKQTATRRKKVEKGKEKREIGRDVTNTMKKGNEKENGELSNDKDNNTIKEVVSSSRIERESNLEYTVASATTTSDEVSCWFWLVGILIVDD
jgi:hypothetical protein